MTTTVPETLAWLALFGTGHVFFGNLYEAVVYVPNLLPMFELQAHRQAPLFPRKSQSPFVYYVPIAGLWFAVAMAAAICGVVLRAPGRRWLLLGGSLWVVAVALTAFVVVGINLDLFFKPQTDLERVAHLLRRWTRLNVIRMVVLAGSAAGWVMGIRSLLS